MSQKVLFNKFLMEIHINGFDKYHIEILFLPACEDKEVFYFDLVLILLL